MSDDVLRQWLNWHAEHPETGPRYAGVEIAPQVRRLVEENGRLRNDVNVLTESLADYMARATLGLPPTPEAQG